VSTFLFVEESMFGLELSESQGFYYLHLEWGKNYLYINF